MIATIAVIAATAEKKKFSDHMETTLQRSQRPAIAEIVVAAIAKVFLFSAITAMVAIIWKPGFNLIMAYFKRKDCLQRNLCLNCVSL